MKNLYNQTDKKILKQLAENNQEKRLTLSFYRYIPIRASQELRDLLYLNLFKQRVLGRIYLAKEGINAQISVLEDGYQDLVTYLNRYDFLKNISIKQGLQESRASFVKLVVKIRKKIVADGLEEGEIDFSKVGRHVDPREFNRLLEQPETVVVDVRNHYESEVGHFDRSLRVDSDTFREQLPMIKESLQGKEEQPILLYCTGGIRCEKASAYLIHHGFKQVAQLDGGIIQYAHQVKTDYLVSKFRGKNFVFDHRLGERISKEVIANCHQCGVPCDEHTNCGNDDCHLLFIQCEMCQKMMEGCCSKPCQEIVNLPIEEQIRLRKGRKKQETLKVYRSRLRPKLNSIHP